MATGSTLYRFQLELSDIDRGVYESLDFRVALHPSETLPFMALRVLAYALNYREGLEDRLAMGIDRANSWTVLHQEGSVTVGRPDSSGETAEVRRLLLSGS